MNAPLISVVAGVHNGGRYLRPSLESALSQQGADFELIVVDDGSTDGSTDVLLEMARADGRLRVVMQPRQGLTRALIRGCAVARGRFIARHDADDLSLPGRLAAQAQLLEADDRLALVSCWVRAVGPEGEALFETTRPRQPERATRQLTAGEAGPYHGSVMFRADTYRRAGGYRAAFRYAQDWDLWLRLADEGLLGYVPEVLYASRVRDGSISAVRREQQRRLAVLARRCREARLAGLPEVPHLAEAVRTSAEAPDGRCGPAANNYFIGKCLLDRRDARALGYLGQTLRQNPWHARGWLALVAACLRCRPRGESEPVRRAA